MVEGAPAVESRLCHGRERVCAAREQEGEQPRHQPAPAPALRHRHRAAARRLGCCAAARRRAVAKGSFGERVRDLLLQVRVRVFGPGLGFGVLVSGSS